MKLNLIIYFKIIGITLLFITSIGCKSLIESNKNEYLLRVDIISGSNKNDIKSYFYVTDKTDFDDFSMVEHNSGIFGYFKDKDCRPVLDYGHSFWEEMCLESKFLLTTGREVNLSKSEKKIEQSLHLKDNYVIVYEHSVGLRKVILSKHISNRVDYCIVDFNYGRVDGTAIIKSL